MFYSSGPFFRTMELFNYIIKNGLHAYACDQQICQIKAREIYYKDKKNFLDQTSSDSFIVSIRKISKPPLTYSSEDISIVSGDCIQRQCSLGLRPGEQEGHYKKTATLSVSKKNFATLLLCGGALSCINKKSP